MSGWRVRCAGRADGTPGPEAGMYLQRFDALALGGRGWLRWTGNPAEAMRFDTPAAAQRTHAAVPMLGRFRVDIEPAR